MLLEHCPHVVGRLEPDLEAVLRRHGRHGQQQREHCGRTPAAAAPPSAASALHRSQAPWW